LRIGIDYTAAVRQRAGIGRYARGLVRALARLDTENEYVLLVVGRPKEEGTFPPNFKPRYLPLSPHWATILWQRLQIPFPADLLTGPLDLFHSPDYVLPPLRGGKRVLTIHDLSFLRYPEGADPRLRWYLTQAVPRSIGQADLVLADSLNTKSDLIELLGVEAGRVEVLYPGVEERFRPLDEESLVPVQARYSLDFPFILTVGTLEPRKNHVGLLHAYSLLKGRCPHRLVIAGGKGWLYEDIFQEVERLGLEEMVFFLGYVPEEDLPALYNLADLFVFPSFYEGFGLPPLEAMACGTPVVVSDLSSLPEVVGDGALLIPPQEIEALAEAMEKALSDPSLREELRSKGLERAKRFTWSEAAKRLLTIYEQMGGEDG
jgi:glycosyltransferase involved in cell wall biosynthesis